jgi:hypothetical protein
MEGLESTGTAVKLHGLVGNSHLNGQIGCVINALSGNRYQVKLAEGPAGAERMVSVKGKNLRILQSYTLMVFLVKKGRASIPLCQVMRMHCCVVGCVLRVCAVLGCCCVLSAEIVYSPPTWCRPTTRRYRRKRRR